MSTSIAVVDLVDREVHREEVDDAPERLEVVRHRRGPERLGAHGCYRLP